MAQLQRELGVFGAVMMGLGSIVGTGVFVSIGIAAGVTGPSVVIALALAAAVATFNGLSSAQLAANHPVSGGTYEYGYRYLNPWIGFTAGWMFLSAKSASAATAALGFAGYVLNAFGVAEPGRWLVPLALLAVIVITAIVYTGIRRSNVTNIIIVTITLATLALFVVTGLPAFDASNFAPFIANGPSNLLTATALMFVAYTGYGRIATMGEEVREPRKTIPRAIIAALVTVGTLYIIVAVVGIGAAGVDVLADAAQGDAAPLEIAAQMFAAPWVSRVVAVGAIIAMLGVLLNLVLGLSRVLLAMGRRGDMPPQTANLNAEGTTPTVAVIVMGVVIGGLALTGDVGTTWRFSAVTVLIYYAITNASALQLGDEERLFPRWVSWAGLVAGLGLSFVVNFNLWVAAMVLIVVGLIWRAIASRVFAPPAEGEAP